MSGAETARRRVVQRRVGSAETAVLKWPSPLNWAPRALHREAKTSRKTDGKNQ